MSWKGIKQAVLESYLLVLVVGSTEQHGPHLPVGVEVFIPMGIAERVARIVKAVIAETLMVEMKPELVQMDRVVDDKAERRLSYDIIPPAKDIMPESGVLWKSTLASGKREAPDIYVHREDS